VCVCVCVCVCVYPISVSLRISARAHVSLRTCPLFAISTANEHTFVHLHCCLLSFQSTRVPCRRTCPVNHACISYRTVNAGESRRLSQSFNLVLQQCAIKLDALVRVLSIVVLEQELLLALCLDTARSCLAKHLDGSESAVDQSMSLVTGRCIVTGNDILDRAFAMLLDQVRRNRCAGATLPSKAMAGYCFAL
jgi:hypothetical protein